MKKINLIVSAIFMLLGVGIITIAMGYPTAEQYGTGVPGPGLWPIVISIVMIGCALMLAVKSLRMPAEEDVKVELWNENTIRVYIVMGMLFLYAAVLKLLGFLLATVILEFVLIQWFAKKKYWVTAAIALVVTLVIYCVFKFVLNVPIGSFGLVRF